ncbi:MAG TPA: cytochrome c oxidase subunit II [Candidatus Binatia bacterium]|nr:cytochrome c oxidase subunit II [Candidatus Binatia bacterium]
MHGWFPENVSTFGADIDRLFYLIYYIVTFWFILAEAAILWFLVRYRRRPGTRVAYVRGDRWRELSWILVPASVILLLDLGIDAAGARVWEAVKLHVPPDAMQVGVTAKQFEWLVTYPGPDGRLGTADDFSLNGELHVPQGKNVRVTLRSEDVVHSFFIPNARLKQDAVPGRAIDLWFNLTRPGTYELACAELCGFGHYTMRGAVIVHTPEEYGQWLKQHTA